MHHKVLRVVNRVERHRNCSLFLVPTNSALWLTFIHHLSFWIHAVFNVFENVFVIVVILSAKYKMYLQY